MSGQVNWPEDVCEYHLLYVNETFMNWFYWCRTFLSYFHQVASGSTLVCMHLWLCLCSFEQEKILNRSFRLSIEKNSLFTEQIHHWATESALTLRALLVGELKLRANYHPLQSLLSAGLGLVFALCTKHCWRTFKRISCVHQFFS